MRWLAAFVFLPCAAFGQASIQGLVLDPSGAAVPDAAISATLDATGATRSARTGADGRYRLPALSIGTYTVRCEKPGHAQYPGGPDQVLVGWRVARSRAGFFP